MNLSSVCHTSVVDISFFHVEKQQHFERSCFKSNSDQRPLSLQSHRSRECFGSSGTGYYLSKSLAVALDVVGICRLCEVFHGADPSGVNEGSE